MVEPNSHNQDRNDPSRIRPSDPQQGILSSPSVFVASIVELLQRRNSPHARSCADNLARHGALSGAQFSALVDTLTHPTETTELVRAYSSLTKLSVDVDFADAFPAFLKLTHKCLTDPAVVEDRAARSVARVLDRLLDARLANDDLVDRIDAVLTESDRCLLLSIVERAEQHTSGYWECLELLGAISPDQDSLECLFRAIERLGPGPHSTKSLLGIQRTVAAIGVVDYAGTFEFAASALGIPKLLGDVAVRRAVAAGLAYHVDRYMEDLLTFLESENEELVLFACRVCVTVDRVSEVHITPVTRAALTERLRGAHARFAHSQASGPLADEPLVALAHVSLELSDISEIGREVRERLQQKAPLSSELMYAYATALARIEDTVGVVAFKSLSAKRFAALDAVPRLQRHTTEERFVAAGQGMEEELELLALDIGVHTSIEDVIALCREQEHMLDPRRLRARDPECLSLFYTVEEAVQFAHHHALLSEEGPAEFAAVLFPELLSALASGSSSKNSFSAEIAGYALRSLASLASLAAHDPRIRELAVARLSSKDWNFLGRLPKVNVQHYSSLFPDLGLAGFAVRAVLDDDPTWREELISWWKNVSDRARERVDRNALAFVAVVGERGRPGSAIELLRQVSLVSEDAQTFSDIALGLLGRPSQSVRTICVDIMSHRGDDLCRALLLSQLMAREFNDEQRRYLIQASKGLLDEIGSLGLDAVATLGALSDDRADALLLLDAEPNCGVSEGVHRVTCAHAAARIVCNSERR